MKVTLMIADFARVANGKLDVIGGGWSVMNAQGPFGFFVAALFQIPWDQTNAKHKFRLELLDADGHGVPTPEDETIRAEGKFEVGRPAGLRPGTPVDAPLVVPFGPLVLEDGRYEIRLTINGETKEDWFVAFTVRHALLVARTLRDVGHGLRHAEQVERLRVLHDRHDQSLAVLQLDGEAEVD